MVDTNPFIRRYRDEAWFNNAGVGGGCGWVSVVGVCVCVR
jgi:hypothetical protein